MPITTIKTNATIKPGDLLFFYGNDRVSKIISYWTWGPSHVGIVVDASAIGVPYPDNKLVMLESTTMCPTACLVGGKRIAGIQVQDIETRIAQYGNAPTLLSLRPECRFTPEDDELFHAKARLTIGELYDMPNAVLSGTNILKYLVTPDINTLFCAALLCVTP